MRWWTQVFVDLADLLDTNQAVNQDVDIDNDHDEDVENDSNDAEDNV